MFFTKRKANVSAKAESIIVNGVEYNAPAGGVCSIKVDDGKVIINGKDATERIADTASAKEVSNKGRDVTFENLNVTFKSSSPYVDISSISEGSNSIQSETPCTVKVDIPQDSVMPLNINSHGDVTVYGSIRGQINIDGDLAVTGTYDSRGSGCYKSEANTFTLGSYIGDEDHPIVANDTDITINGDAVGNILFDSSNYGSIDIKGNFSGVIKDTIEDWEEAYNTVDININGMASGSITNYSDGSISIGTPE